jgi:hypothetical protein
VARLGSQLAELGSRLKLDGARAAGPASASRCVTYKYKFRLLQKLTMRTDANVTSKTVSTTSSRL